MTDTKDPENEEFVTETDEAQGEDVEIEDIEEGESDKIKKLREKLKACQKEKNEHLESLQAAKADFLNSKRRLQEQLERDVERTTNTFISKLLPLCDSFDSAMADKEAWERGDASWRNGIEAILAQLNTILKSYNVERVGEPGEAFDPNKHEAVSSQESSEHDPDTILKVMQSGYIRNNELIRPAKVIIST